MINKRKGKWMPAFILMIAVSSAGCYYDKEELLYPGNNTTPSDCSATPASFSTDVHPLITTKCAIAGCHDATASGGFTFQNYGQISSAKDQINVQAVLQKTMPPTGALPPADIKTLKCWLEGGAQNN